ncbi:MAG: DUF3443 domain-containing protein [Betaproteobacteria bacterium]|nr:DUF3443 domain-containing protein [Betaproteobacteria bacterium]
MTLAANSIAAPAHNVLPITVESAASGWPNFAYATVTICPPGSSSNCQSVDHVLVDTGSSGLRIMSSALSPSLVLPPRVDAGGDPIVECAQFASGFTWGPLKLADVKIAGEQAASLAIQVIGDPEFAAIPDNCQATGAGRNTVASFAVNGILGVGVFHQDCGVACAFNANTGIYYVCPPSGCLPTTVPLADQVHNPAFMFAGGNTNGVIVQLPPIAESGAAGVTGALVFGIGTQANNGLGTASVLRLNPATGQITTIYNNRAIADSIIDSGSNAVFFSDPGIPICTSAAAAGFYCPDATQSLTATLQGMTGTQARVDFRVANADALIAGAGSNAFSNLAGPAFSFLSFNWGLPFFYGRSVYVAFDGVGTPDGKGPYVAF